MDFSVFFSSGTVKKVKASDWRKTVGAGGIWDSATAITSGAILDVSGHDVLVLKDNQIIKILLETSINEKEVGIFVPAGFENMVVTDVAGTVKRLKYDEQTYDAKISYVLSDPNSISVSINDQLLAGDLIAFDEQSSIEIEFTLGDYNVYMKTGFDIIGLSNVW
jgi:hypothetical protein